MNYVAENHSGILLYRRSEENYKEAAAKADIDDVHNFILLPFGFFVFIVTLRMYVNMELEHHRFWSVINGANERDRAMLNHKTEFVSVLLVPWKGRPWTFYYDILIQCFHPSLASLFQLIRTVGNHASLLFAWNTTEYSELETFRGNFNHRMFR